MRFKREIRRLEIESVKKILNTDQKSISDLFLKDFLAAEVRTESDKIKETEVSNYKTFWKRNL